MTARANLQTPEQMQRSVAGFFHRLAPMSGLLRSVTGGEVSMVMEFRPTGQRILLDLTSDPLRIETGGAALSGTVSMAGTPEDLHNVLLGDESAARGLDRRRLLLKGGMLQISRFFPFMDLSPALYASHLESDADAAGAEREADRRRPSLFQRLLGACALLAGLVLGRLKRANLIRVLNAMARGMLRALKRKPETMTYPRPRSGPHPLAAPRPGVFKRALLALVAGQAFLGGYLTGFLKHRLHFRFDLFAVMGRMSDGIGRTRASDRPQANE